jgi:hypothetical protein
MNRNNEYGFTKPYSDKTAEMIDNEVQVVYRKLLSKNKTTFDRKARFA